MIDFLKPNLLQYSAASSKAKSIESTQWESDVTVISTPLRYRYSMIKGEGYGSDLPTRYMAPVFTSKTGLSTEEIILSIALYAALR